MKSDRNLQLVQRVTHIHCRAVEIVDRQCGTVTHPETGANSKHHVVRLSDGTDKYVPLSSDTTQYPHIGHLLTYVPMEDYATDSRSERIKIIRKLDAAETNTGEYVYVVSPVYECVRIQSVEQYKKLLWYLLLGANNVKYYLHSWELVNNDTEITPGGYLLFPYRDYVDGRAVYVSPEQFKKEFVEK